MVAATNGQADADRPTLTGRRWQCALLRDPVSAYDAGVTDRPLIIAVDGPAASGKGTIARALARRYGLPHLDTGKLYRATGLAVRLAGGVPEDAALATAVAQQLDPELLDDPQLMSSENAQAASIVSAHPAVRAALLAVQRAFADQRAARCSMAVTSAPSSPRTRRRNCLSRRRRWCGPSVGMPNWRAAATIAILQRSWPTSKPAMRAIPDAARHP